MVNMRTSRNMPEDVNKYRKTDPAYGFLVQHLFGDKEYRLIHSSHTWSDAKRIFKRYCKRTRTVIETAALMDHYRKQALLKEIDKAEGSLIYAKSFNTLDQVINVFQMDLISLLLDSTYGQIQYIQDANHKMRIISAAIQGKYKGRFGDWDNFLSDIYAGQCNSNPQMLIDWIRMNHPDIYCALF